MAGAVARRRWIAIFGIALLTGCTGPSQHLDFTALGQADRVAYGRDSRRRFGVIAERRQIIALAAFADAHSDDFFEGIGGGRSPLLWFDFYSRDRHLGGFGLAPSYVTEGDMSRATPSDEIERLLRDIGLTWPTEGAPR